MAITSPQTFGKDYVLNKLVAHFNSQPASQRIIRTNDFPFYNVKVVQEGENEPALIVGDLSADYTNVQFLGEATYTWIGPRNTPTVATAAHFFEVSKFVNNPATGSKLNIVNRVATFVGIPSDSSGNDLNNLPMDGDYTIQFRILAPNADLWDGDYIALLINDTVEYMFWPTQQGETLGFFRVNTGDRLEIYYEGQGNIGSTFQAFQHPTDDPNDMVDVYFGSVPDAPEFSGPETIADFYVPLTNEVVDFNVGEINSIISPESSWLFGSSVAINESRTLLAVRGGDATQIHMIESFNQSNMVLSPLAPVTHGQGLFIDVSEPGAFMTALSSIGTVAEVLTIDPASEDLPVFINDSINVPVSVFASYVRYIGATPFLFVVDSNASSVIVYEKDGSNVWTQVKQLEAASMQYCIASAVLDGGTKIVVATNGGWVTMYEADPDQGWAADVTVTDLSSLWSQEVSREPNATLRNIALSANGDIAFTYSAPAGPDQNISVFVVYEATAGGQVVSRVSVMDRGDFVGLTNCDRAYSNDIVDRGFMALLDNSTTAPTLVWISRDMLNPTTSWIEPHASNPNLVATLPLTNTQFDASNRCTPFVPVTMEHTQIRLVVGTGSSVPNVSYHQLYRY